MEINNKKPRLKQFKSNNIFNNLNGYYFLKKLFDNLTKKEIT